MRPRDFRCPRCGGSNTQTFEAAYHQHARHGSHSVNELAHLVAPPGRKSTAYTPVLMSVIVAYLATLLSPIILYQLKFLSDELIISPLDPLALTIGLSSGGFIGYLLRVRAKRYNATTFLSLFRAWQKQIICRRCSHEFELPIEELAQ